MSNQNTLLNAMTEKTLKDSPTLIDGLKARLAKMVMPWASKKWGGVVQVAAGSGIAWVANNVVASSVAWLSNHGIVIPEEMMKTIYNGLHDAQEFIIMAGGVAFVSAVQYVQTHYNIKLQEAIGTPADGYVGPETVRKAIEVKEEATL